MPCPDLTRVSMGHEAGGHEAGLSPGFLDCRVNPRIKSEGRSGNHKMEASRNPLANGSRSLNRESERRTLQVGLRALDFELEHRPGRAFFVINCHPRIQPLDTRLL
jgi:hypothetical protein